MNANIENNKKQYFSPEITLDDFGIDVIRCSEEVSFDMGELFGE